MSKEETLDIEKITSVLCECGHKLLYHYFGEGCCDRSVCWCKEFKPEKPRRTK